ncbi:unnamed protein product [Bursaphelenchus okinawaensis]|uniref:Uncharacterized protein n=1 Tax=Bursaphelenchus okinawaensis TaxID=465554 RepID=A0A811JVG8_9BILA|nr:unnamed protein product [Bursaphelenchus okinawaensis]CAG9085166.1 unnamed protein product [Bursaphelenchus okinawaensis]
MVVILVFLLSITFIQAQNEVFISLDAQCKLSVSPSSDNEPGHCSKITSVNIDETTFLVLRVKDASTLEYATVFMSQQMISLLEASPIQLHFEQHDFKHALRTDCVFQSETFNAFVDDRVLYVWASCGLNLGLVRTIIHKTRILVTPPVPPIYVNAETDSNFSTVGFTDFVRHFAPEQVDSNTIIYESMKDSEKSVITKYLHDVNVSYPTPYKFKSFYVVGFDPMDKLVYCAVNEFDNGNVSFYVADVETGDFNYDAKTKPRSAAFTYFYSPHIAQEHVTAEYKWISHYLVNDDINNHYTQPMETIIENCVTVAKRKKDIIGVIVVFIMIALSLVILTVAGFALGVLIRKRDALKA